jgi:4-hydroxy-4-methyl-2-oxoglutarate aldolase
MISGPAGTVIKDFKRAPADLIKQFAAIPTSIIVDCYARYPVLSPTLNALNPDNAKFAGSALTCEDLEGGNFMSLFAIEYSKPGDVLVIDVKGIISRAGLGSINALVFKNRGGKAIIVNGAVRDSEELADLGIPVFCIGATPAGPHKGVKGNVNCPIAIGSATICPGDILVGDRDGIVCIPIDDAHMVLEAALARLETEAGWLQQINEGKTFAQILGVADKLESYNVIVQEHA